MEQSTSASHAKELLAKELRELMLGSPDMYKNVPVWTTIHCLEGQNEEKAKEAMHLGGQQLYHYPRLMPTLERHWPGFSALHVPPPAPPAVDNSMPIP